MSHTLPALQHALTRLSATTPRLIPSPPTQPRRASVAIILRVRPHPQDEPYLGQQYDAEGVPLPGSDVDRVMSQSGLGQQQQLASSSSSSSATSALTPTTTPTQQTLSSFFSLPWVARGTPELLYIKRATRSSDKWSAHVAFPGGRQDETDEDSLYTAMRETWEEVGLDLADRDFLQVGMLDEREITSSLGKRLLMVLSPFGESKRLRAADSDHKDDDGLTPIFNLLKPPCRLVFLQTTPFPHTPDLQPTEVASAHWIEIANLYNPTPKWGTVSIDIATRLAPRSNVIRAILKGLLGKMEFRCIRLKNEPWAVADYSSEAASSPGGSEEGRRKDQAANILQGEARPDLQLWGLTLGMTIDLLAHMSTYRTDSTPTTNPCFGTSVKSSATATNGPLTSASPSPATSITSMLSNPSLLATTIRDRLHLNPPKLTQQRAPSLTSVYPRFSNPDVNFWIYIFSPRYRRIIRSWSASLETPSERLYNWSGLALGAFYTAVRRALIVAVVMRAIGAMGLVGGGVWWVWKGRRREVVSVTKRG